MSRETTVPYSEFLVFRGGCLDAGLGAAVRPQRDPGGVSRTCEVAGLTAAFGRPASQLRPIEGNINQVKTLKRRQNLFPT